VSGRIKSILEYLIFRSGPLSLSINQGGGFIRWKNREDYPNLQVYFNPLTYSVSHANKRPLLKTDKFDGFIIGFQPCRPNSRGSIRLLSKEINDDPLIDPGYLSNEKDLYDLECAYDFVRKISQTHSLDNIIDHPIGIDLVKSSAKEMISHFRQNATSVFHPCGTCKMGPDKDTSVVSNRLKVHGLQNLWVVDASVFPNITSGNINAPVMMTAYIGGNLISEDIKKLT
jgi:choline dehydrogenase